MTDMERGKKMFDGDVHMRQLGARLVSIGDQSAVLSLVVNETHVQGHGTCHGGVIFALADAGFGVACNLGDYPAVAQQCSINYLRPCKIGDTLTATIECRSSVGRSGIFDATVRDQGGNIVAEFRGLSRQLPPKQ